MLSVGRCDEDDGEDVGDWVFVMMGVLGLFSFCCLGWQTDLLRNENNRFVEERKDAFAALAKQNQEMSSRITHFSEKLISSAVVP